MNIITNNKQRHFKYGYEVPKSVMADQFDHLSEDERHDGFIYYRRYWYHISDFLRSNHPELIAKGYHGIHTDSFFSGVAIKVSSDGESYQIATVLS
jgi:hypothetical protein